LLRKRTGTERREAIDIDAVIAAKYPNRAASAVALDESGDEPDIAPVDEPVDEPVDSPVVAAVEAAPVLPPPPVPARRRNPQLGPTPPGFPAPLRKVSPAVPIPGEPDEFLPADAPSPTSRAAQVDAFSGDPFQQLARRRERVAAQAAEAFREVHKLRTEALRRASQAEHNASLAAHARTRAGRMARDTRRVESQGRRRPSQVPTSEDAYHDVHRFRTEALKRAQQAEHGAQNVAQARERATRLLAEQREIEAEMAKLQRLRNATAAIAASRR
jgi:hypothetical protein